MPQFDTTCLYSTVRNISGVEKHFGFLPPHGRTLESNEEMTIFGSVLESVIRNSRSGGRRNQLALERALRDGNLEIVSYPAPIVYDEEAGQSVMLQVSDGALQQVDPCWANSLSV